MNPSLKAQDTPPAEAIAPGQPLSVEPLPFLTLGSVDGDPDREFLQVVTPFLLPPDRVIVPLSSLGEIRVFTLEGELVAVLGRLGEGPGEFRGLDKVWARGDTIEASDSRLMRITRFLPDGKVETVRLNSQEAGYRTAVVIPGGIQDGWLATGVTGISDSRRMDIGVARFSRDGSFLGTIAHVEATEMYSPQGSGPPTDVAPLSPLMFSSIRDSTLYLGETLTPSIRIFDANGKEMGELTWEADPPAPEDALREAIELAVQRAGSGEKRELRERLEAAPQPEKVPVFSDFQVDDLGFVWVRPYLVERDAFAFLYVRATGGAQGHQEMRSGGEWWVFTPKGDRVGSIDIPPGLVLYDVTSDAVVGVRRDEFGVEHVQVHRLHRKKQSGIGSSGFGICTSSERGFL